jgi:hypothetical protein
MEWSERNYGESHEVEEIDVVNEAQTQKTTKIQRVLILGLAKY